MRACREGPRRWPEHAAKRIMGRQSPNILPRPPGSSRQEASQRAALAPQASASRGVAPRGSSTLAITKGACRAPPSGGGWRVCLLYTSPSPRD
eukprot:5402735-Alexandrium_andersonii.AAC.1